jgi:predicted secreted protein
MGQKVKNYCFLLLLVVPSLISCSESSSPTGAEAKSISIKASQQYILKLETALDAGYHWKYTISDTGVVKLDSTNSVSENTDSQSVGGGALETFYFSGKRTGECVVILSECRAWEKNTAPLSSVELFMYVK